MKRATRTAVALFLCLPLVALARPAQQPPREIAVQGAGRVAVAPDEASISLGILTRSRDVAAARIDVNERTAAVLALLEALAIEARHISAPGLTLRPEYRWNKDTGQQELDSYLVQRRVDVRLTDLSRLGELVEGAADAGANEVSPPVLGHSREAQLRREALAAAARDARANAEAIAASLGIRVGAVRSISAQQGPRPMPAAREMLMRSADSAPASESYVTGDLVFESRVTAAFDLLTEAPGTHP